jgi:hypothetical protein
MSWKKLVHSNSVHRHTARRQELGDIRRLPIRLLFLGVASWCIPNYLRAGVAYLTFPILGSRRRENGGCVLSLIMVVLRAANQRMSAPATPLAAKALPTLSQRPAQPADA